ncbi:hypothetical protein BJY52DRAFT_1216271 [Lactarius psammicola]|nr:hypothetical protein BJY52DRAFT_1216271 [Lactarius psammicola]
MSVEGTIFRGHEEETVKTKKHKLTVKFLFSSKVQGAASLVGPCPPSPPPPAPSLPSLAPSPAPSLPSPAPSPAPSPTSTSPAPPVEVSPPAPREIAETKDNLHRNSPMQSLASSSHGGWTRFKVLVPAGDGQQQVHQEGVSPPVENMVMQGLIQDPHHLPPPYYDSAQHQLYPDYPVAPYMYMQQDGRVVQGVPAQPRAVALEVQENHNDIFAYAAADPAVAPLQYFPGPEALPYQVPLPNVPPVDGLREPCWSLHQQSRHARQYASHRAGTCRSI